ncbi:MAG: cytochrome c biogenesis protein CcdA [Planctomycetota bacterium]
MREETLAISKHRLLAAAALIVCIAAITCCASAAGADVTKAVELARHETEFSSVRFEPARMGERAGIVAIFEGTHDLHYYASPQTAPAPGFELKIAAKSDDFEFGDAIFPKWEVITDPVGAKVEVYAGNFTVFVPIKSVKAATKSEISDVQVKITGITCTSMLCLPPFEKTLPTSMNYGQRESWSRISIEGTGEAGASPAAARAQGRSAWLALALAFLAGLTLNIMPCVWPVLPIVIMRIVEQARTGKRQSVIMGLAFCIGILLFFACLAGANIILQSFYGRTLSWGDHLRNPVIVTAMALLMIVMALFMFGIFNIALPSSIAGKSGSGKGYASSIGMGFLAAILSTPCSFGILTVAFVWAQGQPPAMGTLAIMVIGLGMAAPYAILASVPRWLNRLPRGGRWMELFKQALGFLLLVIAVKLVKAVPEAEKINVLYFAVVLSFCVWMWGTWVTFGSKLSRKLLVRGIALLVVVLAAWFFFKPELVNWQGYDSALIASAKSGQRPVLVKFTADWCTNCEVVDKFVYQRKDIAKLIEKKGVLAIKADTTRADLPATVDLKNIYNEPGVPVTLLFLPGRIEPVRLHNLFFGDELRRLLEELPDSD